MQILLPVDGSDYTKRMLAYVAAYDELLGAAHEYTFLTVVPPIPLHAARFLDRSMLEALGNVLLGSVASGVLARCTLPVLLIR